MHVETCYDAPTTRGRWICYRSEILVHDIFQLMLTIDNIAIQVPAEYAPRLKAIEYFDYAPVAKKVNLELGGVTERYLNEGIENLKRYYIVGLLDGKNPHSVSKPLDVFWHCHVLFSHEYFDFCERVYGIYVHHVPLDRDDPVQVAAVQKIYDYTLAVHNKVFKHVDSAWWPKGSGDALICYQPNHGKVGSATFPLGLFPRNEEIIPKVL